MGMRNRIWEDVPNGTTIKTLDEGEVIECGMIEKISGSGNVTIVQNDKNIAYNREIKDDGNFFTGFAGAPAGLNQVTITISGSAALVNIRIFTNDFQED